MIILVKKNTNIYIFLDMTRNREDKNNQKEDQSKKRYKH